MTQTPHQLDLRPFEAIPPRLALHLRSDIARAADDILFSMLGPSPASAEGAKMREEIVAGLTNFSDLVDSPGPTWERLSVEYFQLGRQVARDGRDLEEVHRTLRRAARATWRKIGRAHV